MPIHVNCPTCGQRLTVPSTAAGRALKCAACGAALRVPVPRDLLSSEATRVELQPLALDAMLRRAVGVSSWAHEVAIDALHSLAGRLEPIAARPVRLVVLVVLLIVGYFGVAAAKWALSGRAPQESPPAVLAKPAEPDPWDGVGTSDANDHVRVTAESVTSDVITIRRPDAALPHQSAKAFLKIVLKIQNLSGSEPLHYSGWGARWAANDQAATLKDNEGIPHKQFDGRELIVGQVPSLVIRPSDSIKEILAFHPPGTYAKYLKLVLPASACGGTGELRIKIPRNQFLD